MSLPDPWYRKSRGVWMVTTNGKQVPLGVTDPDARALALEAVKRLLGGDGEKPALPCGDAAGKYLAGLPVGAGTRHIYRQYLVHFQKAVGVHRDLHTLTAKEVEGTAPGAWASSTAHGYLGAIGVFLRAAGVQLDRKLKRPPKESRGAGSVWTEQEYYLILGAARGDFRALVQVLWLTGARPSEVLSLTVEGIDWKRGTATLNRHKNAGKGKSRVIHFPEQAMAVLRKQRDKHEAGFLFRQGDGCRHPEKPMTMKGAGARMVSARERAGITRNVFLYGLRHGFATRALERGFTAEQVAALIGNSATVVNAHYGHVGANHELMRKIAESVAG